MERFCCTTRVIAGDGALTALKEMGIGRLMVVTDPYFMKNGTAERIAGFCNASKVAYFSEVTPDPTVELVARGTSQVKDFAPDTILALGGGSAMDCAKAMGYFSGVPVVAVPTTSGSGSEVTDFAILTHNRVKHPLVDEKLRPKAAILDATLLESLPGSLIADAGFDVLSHALEAYVAKNAGAITDALARDAFCTAFGALPASFGGNRSVRGQIHTAATMAGIAFNQAGLGLCHAMSHSLGGLFHVPHGRLNAILLPEVITCNGYTQTAKYARLARSAGLGGAADNLAVRNLKNALIRLRRELKLPATLAQAGIDPVQVRRNSAQIVEAAIKDPCCATNPITVEPFMVHRILEEVTGRV